VVPRRRCEPDRRLAVLMRVLRANNAATAAKRRAQLIVRRERIDALRLAGGFAARSGLWIRDNERLPRVVSSSSLHSIAAIGRPTQRAVGGNPVDG